MPRLVCVCVCVSVSVSVSVCPYALHVCICVCVYLISIQIDLFITNTLKYHSIDHYMVVNYPTATHLLSSYYIIHVDFTFKVDKFLFIVVYVLCICTRRNIGKE